jgi:signal transduction histidine kinase
LDAQGLSSALEELARATRERFGLDCRFEAREPVAAASKTMATHLYHIAQEAVNNAIKHGNARSIRLRLEERDGRLELRVEDDGQGIAPAKLAVGSGMGLHIMDYRARSIGGTLSVGAGAGGGTAICCCVPGANS